jgi:hypothetical protein
MKAIAIGLLSGITLSVAIGLGSVANHSEECARAQRLGEATQPVDWDKALTQGGYPNPTKRAQFVQNLEIDLQKYPGNPCGGMTGIDVINAILSGILIFAVIVIPSAVFRGIFPRGKHD